jgi:hypothetical protein
MSGAEVLTQESAVDALQRQMGNAHCESKLFRKFALRSREGTRAASASHGSANRTGECTARAHGPVHTPNPDGERLRRSAGANPSASTFAHVLHDGRYKVGESARRGSVCLRSVCLSMATSPRSPRHAPVHVMLMLQTRVTVRCACARRSREEQLLICFARRHGLSGAATRL